MISCIRSASLNLHAPGMLRAENCKAKDLKELKQLKSRLTAFYTCICIQVLNEFRTATHKSMRMTIVFDMGMSAHH